MSYEQIEIYNNDPERAIHAWKLNNWSMFEQTQPAAKILEKTNCFLLLEVPGHENEDREYTPLMYQLWGITEEHIYSDSKIYIDPDMHCDNESLEALKASEYYQEIRNQLIEGEMTTYDLSGPIPDRKGMQFGNYPK